MKMWVVILSLLSGLLVNAEPQVPCYFVFGDSLSENGNNNARLTLAKANYLPYGIDFPNGPTGRFTNGRTIADRLAELLGFEKYIPPFASATGPEILKGVNYASAAAGIRDETGKSLGPIISLNEQFRNHETTISKMRRMMGNEASVSKHLNKCIYTVNIGSNDYLLNYFSPLSRTRRLYTPQQYAMVLIQQYTLQLKRLYKLGARKVGVFGLGPIGCTPSSVAFHGRSNGSECVEFMNTAVQIFNARLTPLVDEFNSRGANFIYVNLYHIAQNPPPNFRVRNAPCCKVALNNIGRVCIPLSSPCRNRDEYIYWDADHPTDAANVAVAQSSYQSLHPAQTYPFDINHLANL